MKNEKKWSEGQNILRSTENELRTKECNENMKAALVFLTLDKIRVKKVKKIS